jgi:hypothetical protein
MQLARTQLAVAQLDLAEGRDPAEAEAKIAEALPVLERERLSDDQAVALAVRAEAELARGDHERASSDATRASELAKTTEQLLVRVAVARARGLVLGDRAAVDAVRTDAQAKGFAFETLELALVSARVAGDRAAIASVEKDAKTAGFVVK